MILITDSSHNAAVWSFVYTCDGRNRPVVFDTDSCADDALGKDTASTNAQDRSISVECDRAQGRFSRRIVSDALQDYEWDAAGRLASARDPNAWRGDPWWSFEYDHRGRRVMKRNWTVLGNWSPPDGHSVYFYDGWNLVHEIRVSGSYQTSHVDYFWGPDLSGTLQGAGGVGGLVAVSINGFFYFPGYDNNGNVVGYWDESGSLVAEYSYDAFGNTISSSGSMASVFPHRFSTKYHDSDTALYYYGYRYYAPSLGRWISRDPIQESGGYNLHSSCCNNLFSRFDPRGLKVIIVDFAEEPNDSENLPTEKTAIKQGCNKAKAIADYLRDRVTDDVFRNAVNKNPPIVFLDNRPFRGERQEYIAALNHAR